MEPVPMPGAIAPTTTVPRSDTVPPAAAARRSAQSPQIRHNYFFGAAAGAILIVVWWLLALLELAPLPSWALVAKLFAPMAKDLVAFLAYNLAHNLPYLFLLAGLIGWFEAAFRRRVAARQPLAPVVGQFKRLALLGGILTMAFSLPGVLESALANGGDAKAAVGKVYYKFAVFVLGAVIFELRIALFEHVGKSRRYAKSN